MPTNYTHAHRFDANADTGAAPANAAYNDLAAFTWGLLVRWDGATDNTLVAKGNISNALYAKQIFDGRIDFIVQRSTGGSIFRGNGITVDNAWRWVFLTLNRTTVAHTRHVGPKGGTLATVSITDVGGAPGGTVISDAAQTFNIGQSGSNVASRNMEYAFVGIWDSALTLAQAQAVVDDLTTAIQPVSAWKPGAADAASVPNLIIAEPLLPAMTMSSTTLVDGPDALAPTDLQLRFSAGDFFADTVVMPEATGVVPWFEEDFSSYANTAALVGTAPAPSLGGALYTGPFGGFWTQFYRENGGAFTLENEGVNINGLALTKSLRVGFPDSNGWTDDVRVVNGVADRLDNYTMRPNLQPNGAAFATQRHLWFEGYIKFSPTWDTRPNPAWGGGGADHKTWLINAAGGSGRWEVKIGGGDGVPPGGSFATPAIKVGRPGDEDKFPNLKSWLTNDAEGLAVTYWDNQWHRIRIEVDIDAGVFRVWMDDTLIHQETGTVYSGAITGFEPMQMGANRNCGMNGAQHFSWGLIRIYNANPGWLP